MWPCGWISNIFLGLAITPLTGFVGAIAGVIGLICLSVGPRREEKEVSTFQTVDLNPIKEVQSIISRELVIRDLHGNTIGISPKKRIRDFMRLSPVVHIVSAS